MSGFEVPLFRQTESYVSRLAAACRHFAEPQYFSYRRVNWSHRFSDDFHAREIACYLRSPQDYLDNQVTTEPALEDVFQRRVGARQTLVVLLKVLAHWLFNLLGRATDARIRAIGARTYRKCYVDDIELVYDRDQPGVVRAVFPFPLSIPRQWRYISYLRRNGIFFKFDGNPYLGSDLLRFLVRRDVRALMRLESRAQLRLAHAVVGLGFTHVQLSDEFDIGSLDFTRALARHPVRITNSAHGIGKYLPVHGYQEFFILTEKQRRYYQAVRPCHYTIRRLNEKSTDEMRRGGSPAVADDSRLRLVCLSQVFDGSGSIIADNERELLHVVRSAFLGDARVQLLYKPHPNQERTVTVPDFTRTMDVSALNRLPGTIYFSFYSTCQIDPSFAGVKILIRGRYIHPEIAFDDSEPVMNSRQFVDYVQSLLGENLLRKQTTGDLNASAPARWQTP